MVDELADYDYTLPEELIARQPSARREEARLMLVDRPSGRVTHHQILDLPELLSAGDRLVFNNSRVLPARLFGRRAATGGHWEGLYLQTDEQGNWRLLATTRGKVRPGEIIEVHPAAEPDSPRRLPLRLVARDEDGIWIVEPPPGTDPIRSLLDFGTLPLPPYIERPLATAADQERYQTVYARHFGSVAAPTAGLHFTPELLSRCRDRGIDQSFVTLHVGVGTFRPISVNRLEEHRMHSEWCEVPPETATGCFETRARGGRIISVGTTTTRTLESAALRGTQLVFRGPTDLFIRPPWTFQAIDGLLTNFHLPRSSLLVMISALAGRDLVLHAYDVAIRERYRFFSYGDAMLIL
ncbi:MAG: tRNA preQ1(34) S-adenosylmethionine ribosyltransferase-isomerase QueA [Planctomycetaceae bacterium]|jgi:S-adenosylmethionine:tRNA ribosyltransferase-isomerase